MVLLSLVLVTAVLPGTGILDLFGGEGAHAAQDGIQLTLREDLTVRAEAYWPVFMELTSDSDAIALSIDGDGAAVSEVRLFPLDAPSERLDMNEDKGSLTGLLHEVSSGLLMVTFTAAGIYEVVAEALDAEGRQTEQTAVTIMINESVPRLFGEPSLGPWGEGWSNEAEAGSELGFALSAPIEQWEGADWGTYYNWTISVICPTGMNVGGDLSAYNSGDLRIDRSALNSTSAVSAWENGFNTVFYTAWEGEGGNLLSGTAAMTPNAKELTMGAGTYDEWAKGSWSPSGAGTLKFNHPGHYVAVIAVSDPDGPVSRPLVLETTVA